MAKKCANLGPFRLASWIILLSALTFVSCVPTNLRIQVNNENLSNAPYLLEAIKLIENSTPQQPTQAAQSSSSSLQLAKEQPPAAASSTTNAPITAAAANKPENRANPVTTDNLTVPTSLLPSSNRSSEEDYEGTDPNSFSVIKEETIEEIIDLDPETAPKATPTENTGSAANDYTKITDLASAENQLSADGRESAASNEGDDKSSVPSGFGAKHDRKPQMPVTNSHLKKPAYGSLNEESEASSTIRGTNVTETGGGGAKSLVSPTVLADEPPSPKLNKKLPSNLPDTLEPAQIMNGVTNASAVPGIVSKEYGHQTRTRITLGGGYVRDRLPPLVNPASDAYVDNRPEKPVTSLEKTRPINTSSGDKSEKREIEEENPQPSEESADDTNSNSKAGKVDSRCPKDGVRTLDHPTACDKYYYCEDGYLTERTCPNGLMYGTREIVKDHCVHRWKADCQDKSIPNPISSPGCRWQYGIFNVQGSPKCSPDYYECAAGKFEVKKCLVDGQIYDDRTKSCRYAEQAGCASEALADFHCPADDQANTYWPFPRYFLNERALIHCVNDKPEIVRCTDAERVDPEHLHCVPIAKLNNGPPVANSEARRSRDKKKSTQ